MAPSLVWIDCEMTGLLATDKLIEIAVIITDDDLNIVAEVRAALDQYEVSHILTNHKMAHKITQYTTLFLDTI